MTRTLTKNIAANFLGNAWVALLAILVVPLYIKLVGYESYGLIGFYATVQITAFLLDSGLSATISREMASFGVSDERRAELRNLARTVEILYWTIGLVLGLIIASGAHLISTNWLASKSLSPVELRRLVILMGLAVAARWPFVLYLSGLAGLRRQVLQNAYTAVVESVRIAGSIFILAHGHGLETFFFWQILVWLVASLLIRRAFWTVVAGEAGARFDWATLFKVGRFAVGMSGIGIAVTILVQTDKLVLSKMLTLAEFGQYMAASTLASGLYLVSKPIFAAHSPELAHLVAEGDVARTAEVFRRGYQVLAVFLLPLAAILMCFSGEILELWTRDAAVASALSPVLAILVLGTALNGVMNIPYALQLAHGWTSLTLKLNVASAAVLVPAVVFLIRSYGMTGAAAAWVALNVGAVLISIPIMRKHGILPESCFVFYRDALILPGFISLAAAAFVKSSVMYFGLPTPVGIVLALIGGLSIGIVVSMLALSETRPLLLRTISYLKESYA